MKKAFLVLAICLCNFCTYAQTVTPQPPLTATSQPPVSVQSPNTTAFALYGEVPVSYFTGVPEISIPLYTLKEKEITLPLSLNYHASGIRPDVHPGWVGNGWSFSNPGVITRTVHGFPDDDNQPAISVSGLPPVGFRWNHGALNVNSWSSKDYMQNVASSKYMYYTLDNEPDEFSFNFGKYSGKFYMGYDGKWHSTDRRLNIALTSDNHLACPFPVAPAKALCPWVDGYPTSFEGFIITTEDGTQYIFGGTNAAIEYSISFFAQNTDYWLANSWYLTKIIGPDGSQINFTYTRGPMISQMYISLYERAFDVIANPGAPFLTQTCGSTTGLIPVTGPYDGKLISPLYLKEIDSEQGIIKFNISPTTELIFPIQNYETHLANIPDGYTIHSQNVCFLYGNYGQDYPSGGYPDVLSNSMQWEKLDSIQIYSTANNQLLKQFNFTYSSDPSQRLTLLSAQERDGAGHTLPPYSFNYYHNNLTPLPGYASASVDNWGFSNGQASDVYTVLSGGPNNLFAARQTNPSYLMEGILTNIIYPTGGNTTFTYEPNTYSQEVNVPVWNLLVPDSQDLTAGGLRIRTITSVDPNLPSQTLTKQYYYYKNYTPSTGLTGRSSGVLGLKPKYYWPTYVIQNGNPNTTATLSVFSWQSVLPATENTAGSHIGYSEVEEQDQDGSITDYKFTNYDNGHLDLPYLNNLQSNDSPYVPFNSRQLERGKLIGKNIYNASGKLLDAQTYTYSAFGNGSDSVRALKATVVFLCNTLAGNEYSESTAYYNYTYPYLESQRTDTSYDQNGLNPVTTVTNSTYETVHGLLRQKSFTNSKGQTVNSKYLYPFDVVPSTVDQTVLTTKPVSYMVNNNIIGQPLQVVNSKVTNGTEQIVSASLTTYQGINVTPPSGTSQVTVKPNYNYQLEFVQPPLASGLTNYAVTYSGNNELEQIDSRFIKHAQFVSYDQRGNIEQYNRNPTSSTSPSNTSYIWGYKGLYPIAEIKNASENFAIDTTRINGTGYGDVYPPANGTGTYTGTFIATAGGSIPISLAFSGYHGQGANCAVVVCTISGTTSTGTSYNSNQVQLCVYAGGSACSSVPTSGSILIPAAGTYTLKVSYLFAPTLTSGVTVFVAYSYPIINTTVTTTGANDVFYESFEEGNGNSPLNSCKTGHYCYIAPAATPYVKTLNNIDPGNYTLSYWLLSGGVWSLQTSPVSVPLSGSYTISLIGQIDDVRFYPATAMMTTYTYDPLVGMTSSTDAKGEITYYEYDGLQRLMNVKDKDGNIIRHTDYHYQGQ